MRTFFSMFQKYSSFLSYLTILCLKSEANKNFESNQTIHVIFSGLACHDILGHGVLVQRDICKFHGWPESNLRRSIRYHELDDSRNPVDRIRTGWGWFRLAIPRNFQDLHQVDLSRGDPTLLHRRSVQHFLDRKSGKPKVTF